jgi:hypothetical protein
MPVRKSHLRPGQSKSLPHIGWHAANVAFPFESTNGLQTMSERPWHLLELWTFSVHLCRQKLMLFALSKPTHAEFLSIAVQSASGSPESLVPHGIVQSPPAGPPGLNASLLAVKHVRPDLQSES